MSEPTLIDDSFFYLDEFMAYFEGVRERSEKTVREYRYDLRLFFRFLKRLRHEVEPSLPLEEIDLSQIDAAYLNGIKLSELYRFVSYLASGRKNQAAARARRVASLRSFFAFLHQKLRVIDENPAAELESPKQAKRLPRYLNLEEAQNLLAAAAGPEGNPRDYCILVFFLTCGMRLSELCAIDRKDVLEGKLRVVGKGMKERSIYLNALAKDAVAEWLLVYEAPKDGSDALFVSRNKRRISERAVGNVVKKYVRLAGLDPRRYSAHKLRHTAASLMYQTGQVDLRSLQQILGHESVATTEIYTHITDRHLQEAVEQHPLNLQSDKKSKEERE